MTADHPTREERYAAVLAEHEDVSMDVTTPREFTQYGGWNRNCQCGHPLPDGDAPDEVFYAAHRAHVAAALVAADPAPAQPDKCEPGCKPGGACKWVGCRNAQPDAALSDEERERLHKTMRHWRGTDEGLRREVIAAVNRILAARAAQPVPAPEVSRGVAEVKAEALREAADEWPGWWKFPAWLHDRADHIVRAAHPTDDGADCCRERTTAGGCGCGGGS